MAAISDLSKIPPGLQHDLPHPKAPWKMSDQVFAKLSQQPWTQDMKFKKCVLLPEDPECAFVLKYFHHQKPANYGIARIYCLHQPSLTGKFEEHLQTINDRANTFKPEWEKESDTDQRQEVIDRWKDQVRDYFPITMQKKDREDILTNVRVLPLWHGTSSAVCASIASSGFTFFGKHHFFNPDAKAGTFKNTDPGYFGSGVYFTNSAQYASMYNGGNLLLSWVSMYEPCPVINNVPHPAKGKDMQKLYGQGAYQTYNAHYIPVSPINSSPTCMQYFPCYKGQKPTCDEIVVFQEAQTLPRFWIELAVEFPKMLPERALIPGAFVIDTATLPTTVCTGLSLIAICRHDSCHNKGNAQWISRGVGEFSLRELFFSTTCTNCNQDFDQIDHFLIHNPLYSIKGRTVKDNQLVEIHDAKMPHARGAMISQFSDWKYLNINLK